MAFRTALCRIKESLVGLEYLIFVRNLDSNSLDNSFICSLCEKKGNVNNIILHFISNTHRLKFLKSVFPSAASAFNQSFETRQNLMNILLSDLCNEIETRLGRLTPAFVSKDRTKSISDLVQEHLNNVEHFQEEPSSTLTIDLILKIKIAQLDLENELDAKIIKRRSRSPLKEQAPNDGHRQDKTSTKSKTSYSRDRPSMYRRTQTGSTELR